MNKKQLIQELQFKAIRSSGAGGQHVNKVSSKIELTFDIVNSKGISNSEKERLQEKLCSRITKESVLILQCDESRSQHKNKAIVVKRFIDLLILSLKIHKKRKKTRPGKAAIEKRLKSKRKSSEKKTNRKKPNLD